MELTMQRLMDREYIRDVMARYARGVDRADWDAVRETYHVGAFDDHGDYKGDVDGFIEFGRARTGSLAQCMHFLGNCLIEFASDDIAAVETYFATAHTLDAEAQEAYGAGDGSEAVQLSAYGRYVDRFERRDGQWRVAHRIVVFEATRVYTGNAPPVKPEWAQLQRNANDPIVRLRAELGISN
jgi:hypothetical protein